MVTLNSFLVCVLMLLERGIERGGEIFQIDGTVFS